MRILYTVLYTISLVMCLLQNANETYQCAEICIKLANVFCIRHFHALRQFSENISSINSFFFYFSC